MAGGGPASRRASFPTARPTVAASRADGQTRTTSVLGCSPRAPGRWSSQSVPGRMRASTNHRSPQMCRQGRAASISSGVKSCTTGTPHVIDGDARSVSGSSDISVRPFFPRQRRADRERQQKYQGSVVGESTAASASTIVIWRTASTPPARAPHHWRAASTAKATSPSVRVIARKLATVASTPLV